MRSGCRAAGATRASCGAMRSRAWGCPTRSRIKRTSRAPGSPEGRGAARVVVALGPPGPAGSPVDPLVGRVAEADLPLVQVEGVAGAAEVEPKGLVARDVLALLGTRQHLVAVR